ncbi:MAG TPA: hypothetical protein VGD91_07940 [Trebonia sp.]
MKSPVSGIFRVTGSYDAKSATRITGVITAPGIPATPAEHKTDRQGRWAESDELPVTVDQADPSKFVIMWDEVDSGSWGSEGAANRPDGLQHRPALRNRPGDHHLTSRVVREQRRARDNRSGSFPGALLRHEGQFLGHPHVPERHDRLAAAVALQGPPLGLHQVGLNPDDQIQQG